MSQPNDDAERTARVVADHELLPLTPAQRGMWFADRLSPDYSVNVAQYVDLRYQPGSFDLELFMECSYAVGRELETPYIRLTEVDGVPRQYVDFDYDQSFDVLDFRAEEDPAAAATEWMMADYRRPVDLIHDQLIVIAFLQVADDRTIWYQRAHHLIIDGYAALTNMRRVLDHYNAARRGESPDTKPAAVLSEIVEYEESYRSSTRRETDRAHWRDRVQDLPERVTLARTPAPVPLAFDNVVAGRALTPEVQTRLTRLAKELNSSLAVLLTSAFGAFLARMTGTDDIALSLPITGRANAKIKRSGGMVSNVVPVRLRSLDATTPRELIGAALLELTGALRHQRYRTEDIRRDAGLDASSMSFGPVINMVFFDAELDFDGVDELEYRILASGVLEDLFLNLYQSSPSAPLVVDLHGNPHLYDRVELEGHLERFLHFLEEFCGGLDTPVCDLKILLDGEAEAIAHWETGPEPRHAAADAHLLAPFAERVAQQPGATAVVDGDRSWTYHEFDLLRRDLAARLAAAGVSPGDLVAVDLDRGIDQVAALYAILSCGAAFVPIDPALPAARREHILAVARPTLVLDARWLAGSGFDADGAGAGAGELPPVAGGARPAYVIFTSGSTGTPKGVQVSHAAIGNRLAWVQRDHPITADDVWLYKTPITFDPSMIELFWPLQQGAALVIAAPGGHADPGYLRTLIAERAITCLHFVPSMLDAFADTASRSEATFGGRVRKVFASGEALAPDLANRVLAGSEIELINVYGPTEAAVDVTAHRVVRGETITPIGAVVDGTRGYVLDARLRRVPTGVPGELYLAGVQLADGYVGAPGLSAERFVADPTESGARMYRTGDLVRWNAHGELEYLGRTDFQIKIRGQRVELGEIEHAMRGVPGIDALVAVARQEAGGAVLVVYARAAGRAGDPELATELMQRARAGLPAYMVPSAVVVLDSFPVTDAGKLDRRALPAPVLDEAADVAYRAPESEAERRLAELLGELLGIEQVGMDHNIFALGADSLTASRLVARARSRAGLDLRVGDVLTSATVAEFARTARPVEDGERPALVPRPRPERMPVAFPQVRLWLINRLDAAAATYNMPGAVRLRGAVDIEAMRAAVADLLGRHESLRTVFPDVDGEPVQQLLELPAALGRVALDVVETDEAGLPGVLAAEAGTGFDLVTEPPVRFRLIAVGGADGAVDSHVLMAVLHHIAGDGASLPPLITDLLTAYAARSAGSAPAWAPLPVQYADFTLWQRELLGEATDPQSRFARELEFWTAELADSAEVLALPADRTRTAEPTGAGGYVDAVLQPDTVRGVRALARNQGVTTFAVLQAALATLLARLAGVDDVSIGTTVAGRDEPELAGLIGMFVNTVVLRTRVQPADSVAELVRRANDVRGSALEHASVPFEAVVEAAGHQRSAVHSPLFQVVLTLISDHAQAFGSTDVEILSARPPVAKFDLTVTATETPGEVMALEFSYASDIFEHATVERIAHYFDQTIRAMIADPTAAVGDLPLLTAGALAEVSAGSRGADVRLPDAVSVGDAVARQIDRSPDAVALVFGEREVPYREFGARVNVLARQLISRGVGPECAVALAMPRSVEMMVAIHAVIAAGGQYVPIDLGTPADRAEYMLATSRADLLLVSDRDQAAAALSAAAAVGAQVVEVEATGAIDTAAAEAAPVGDHERRGPVHGGTAAYTLFTSGSTGMPKGVTLPHEAVLNRLWWGLEELPIDGTDVVLQKTPYTFDCSVPELFAPLMVGATLVVLKQGGHLEPEYVAGEIARTRATMVHFVPSMLSVFLDVVPAQRLSELTSVRIVSTTGEALPPAVAAPTRRVWPEALFYNLYGPTEAAVEITYQRIGDVSPDDPTVPIGVPVWNSSAVVLDSRLHQVPDGVPGELYLGGVQLARGYAARPELTADRFVADPFGAPGERLYRTGDLVRRRPDGALEYLGRTDFQVKLRGQRIELGEIEAVLASAPGVVHAAVTVAVSPDGGEHLVGYVCAGPGETPALDAIKAAAADALPAYMVPTVWMVVEDIALNTAGKIDRKALPDPEFGGLDAEYVAPEGPDEVALAEVFADLLGADRVSVTASFFDAGGNSLSAMRLASRAGQALGVDLTVRDVFEAPTVRELAAAGGGRGNSLPRLVAVEPRPEMMPISDVQRGMWLLNQADPASPAYNIAMALRLRGPLDLAALRAATADLVERQEALRTSYPMVGGRPVQLVESADAVLAELDLEVRPVGDDLPAAVGEVTGRGFDVTESAPVRIAVLGLGADDHVVIFVVHHISADGASMAPLASDFMQAYIARSAGHRPHWEPLAVQYADFASWQESRLDSADASGRTERDRQLGYWRDRLAGAPEVIELPTDRPRPPTPTFQGASIDFELPGDLVEALELVGRRHGATLFMVTHAALAILLARLSGRGDVVIGTPYAGRSEPVLAGLVGMFVNTLAMRSTVELSTSFGEFLDQVRAQDLADMEHAEVSFDAVATALGVPRTGAFNPVFQTMFAFQNLDFPSVSIDGLTISPVHEELTAAKVDLQLTLFPTDPSALGEAADGAPMRAQFLYATDLFDEATVRVFAERYLRVLESIAADQRVLLGEVSIATAAEEQAALAAADDRPLSAVIAQAAFAAPDAVAIAGGGVEVTFATLSVTATALAAALPDADAALTTAVMSLVPAIATEGPERLGEVLADLRARAAAVRLSSDDHDESRVQRL